MRALFFALIFAAVSCSVATQDVTQEKLKSEGEIPIVAWHGIPPKETSVERYRELKEAGINIDFPFSTTIENVEKALDAAQHAGVKIMATCH